jgi:hypothetical protein
MKTTIEKQNTKITVVEDNTEEAIILEFNITPENNIEDLCLIDPEGALLIDSMCINQEYIHAYADDLLLRVSRLREEIYNHIPKPPVKKKVKKEGGKGA